MIKTLNNLFTSHNENDPPLFIGPTKHAYQAYMTPNEKYGPKRYKKILKKM